MPFNIFIANDPQNQVLFKDLCVQLCEYGVTSMWDEALSINSFMCGCVYMCSQTSNEYIEVFFNPLTCYMHKLYSFLI